MPAGLLTSALSWYVGHRQLFDRPEPPAVVAPAPVVHDEEARQKLAQVQTDVEGLKKDVEALKAAEAKRIAETQKEQERQEILHQLEERLHTLDRHLGPGRIRNRP